MKKSRAKSIEVRNLRGVGGSTALQNKLVFEVYSVKHSEDFFAIKILYVWQIGALGALPQCSLLSGSEDSGFWERSQSQRHSEQHN